jgi:phage gp29-like protein
MHDWNPDLLRTARMMTQSGNLRLAADLCDDLFTDDRISSALDTRIGGLLGLPLTFDPNGDKRRKSPIVKASEADWWEANPEDELHQLLSWGRVLGVGLGEIIQVEVNGRIIPKLKNWHPRWLSWDDHTREWKLETRSGMQVVTPGNGKWILYTPYGIRSPWTRGKWIALSLWFLGKRYAQTDWARYGEKHGAPVVAGTMPESKAGDIKARKQFAQDLSELGTNGTIVLPPGFDVKLIEATANTWMTFKGQIEMSDKGVAICINGQNLTSDVKSGSLAAAKVHERVLQDLIESDAETASTTLHKQSWQWWAAWNYGNAALAPYPHWDTVPPEDNVQNAQTLASLAPALEALATHGTDTRALLEKFGLPMLEDTQTQTRKTLALLSGATDPSAKNFIDGQLYTDAIADYAIQAARELHKDDLNKLLTAALEGKDFEDVRAKLLEAYQNDLNPDDLAQKLEQALMLGEFAGRFAARDG